MNENNIWLQILRVTPSNENTLLNLARYYEREDLASNALEMYKYILQKNPNNTLAIRGTARCLAHLGDYKNAHQQLAPFINNASTKPFGLITKAHCYIAAHEYEKALETFKLVRIKDTSIWLAIGHIHEVMNHSTQAKRAFEKGYHCSIRNDINMAQISKARAFLVDAQYKKAVDMISRVLKRNPIHHQALLCLARLYLKLNQIEDAIETFKMSVEFHPDNLEGLRQFKVCFTQTMPPLQPHQIVYIPPSAIVTPWTAAAAIGFAFSLFPNIPSSDLLVVGGAVSSYLNGQTIRADQDIDLLLSRHHFNYLKNHPAFRQCPYTTDTGILFQSIREYSPFRIDCFIPNQNDYALTSVKSRDFCGAAVYLDRNFHLHDPTTKGIHDIYHKILSSIAPAQECFAEDPIRLLRAIHYKILGYELSLDIKQAMFQWQPRNSMTQEKKAHFNAVLYKMLSKATYAEFIREFVSFGLHIKIFNLSNNSNTLDALYYELLQCTKKTNASPIKQVRFFNQPLLQPSQNECSTYSSKIYP